jgi:hypothetical protein
VRRREPDAHDGSGALAALRAEAVMSEAGFDPTHAVAFDLARGLVHVDGAPGYAVVPGDALAALWSSAPEAARAAFASSVGHEIGRRAALRLGGAQAVRAASAETVLEHVGGEIALAGLGAMSFERWGQALVIVLVGSPLGEHGDGLLEHVFGAAIATATGAAVRAASLGREGSTSRFLLSGEGGVAKAREILARGASWREAVALLHEPAGGAR